MFLYRSLHKPHMGSRLPFSRAPNHHPALLICTKWTCNILICYFLLGIAQKLCALIWEWKRCKIHGTARRSHCKTRVARFLGKSGSSSSRYDPINEMAIPFSHHDGAFLLCLCPSRDVVPTKGFAFSAPRHQKGNYTQFYDVPINPLAPIDSAPVFTWHSILTVLLANSRDFVVLPFSSMFQSIKIRTHKSLWMNFATHIQ